MAISNLSTGLRPGVCTSTTRPSTPFEGQMIYETDTNRVLVYEGAAWVMIADTDTPPGMELVKVQTVGSAVSSITVNNAFPSGYEAFEVISTGTTATGTDNVHVQLTSGGTPSTVSYYGSMIYALWAGPSVLLHSVDNQNAWLAATATDGSSGMKLNMRFLEVNQARPTNITSTHIRNIGGTFVGTHAVSTAYDGFKLTITSGTVTGGTIRVYGYRNTI